MSGGFERHSYKRSIARQTYNHVLVARVNRVEYRYLHVETVLTTMIINNR